VTWREEWICSGEHPLYLVDGTKVCMTCVKIAEVGAKRKRCIKMNHTVPADADSCALCQRFTKAEWLKQLDLTGETVCPNGHANTHATLKYTLRSGKIPERKCQECIDASAKKAAATQRQIRAAIAKAEGREMDTRAKRRRRLGADYFDWVVALRLIEGKVDEVYDMMRGKHKGATGMEKWVAFHSTHGIDTSKFVRHDHNARPSNVRYQWTETGTALKWEPKTLAQAMAEL